MNASAIDFWLSIPCLMIGFLSCIGNAYVFTASKAFQDYLVPNSNDYIIINLIHWLAFIDFFWVVFVSLNYIPTAFELSDFQDYVCVMAQQL